MASETTPLKKPPGDIEGGLRRGTDVVTRAAGTAYYESLRAFAHSSVGLTFWIVLYLDSLLLFFVMVFRLFENQSVITPIAVGHFVLSCVALTEPLGLALGGANMDMLLDLESTILRPRLVLARSLGIWHLPPSQAHCCQDAEALQ